MSGRVRAIELWTERLVELHIARSLNSVLNSVLAKGTLRVAEMIRPVHRGARNGVLNHF